MARPGRMAITLTGHVADEATQRAAACGLSPGVFIRQIVEGFLAGERCQHGGPRPEAPAPEDHPETP